MYMRTHIVYVLCVCVGGGVCAWVCVLMCGQKLRKLNLYTVCLHLWNLSSSNITNEEKLPKYQLPTGPKYTSTLSLLYNIKETWRCKCTCNYEHVDLGVIVKANCQLLYKETDKGYRLTSEYIVCLQFGSACCYEFTCICVPVATARCYKETDNYKVYIQRYKCAYM